MKTPPLVSPRPISRRIPQVFSLKRTRERFSLNDWIGLIHQVWSRGADSTLELARLLNQARRSLPYGSWSRLWQSGGLPFSKRKGEMLVVIGQEVGKIDAQNSAHLPAAWNTLYCLARLGLAEVERLIQQGRIHPSLTLRQAQTLLAEHHPETRRKTAGSQLKVRLMRFAAFVRGGMKDWTREDRGLAGQQLLELAGEIQSGVSGANFHQLGIRHLNGQPLTDRAGSISPPPGTCSIAF